MWEAVREVGRWIRANESTASSGSLPVEAAKRDASCGGNG